ncbi:flocculation protein FLO11-like protein [Lates japonicus]|uniref:Flocculation protein FLO11-like protein n=1 Tax=Lates japonicus TaxID=270547 RepID=A0AAD3NPF1_LATJO|nr:flocculation protein FLO11-like protein [Lates japonicus]
MSAHSGLLRGVRHARHVTQSSSCSRSLVFDELEPLAPQSASCPWTGHELIGRPHRQGQAYLALTVSDLATFAPRMWAEDQSDPAPATGVLRPLTAGGIYERCDSTGKVQENKSDQFEGGSGSPSSWIIDPGPSYNMLRSSYSPCPSNHGSSTDEGGPAEEGSSYPGWRDQESLDNRTEEKERRMEERKTKVLNVLSKLQDDTPLQKKSSKGHSNFEDWNKIVPSRLPLLSSPPYALSHSTTILMTLPGLTPHHQCVHGTALYLRILSDILRPSISSSTYVLKTPRTKPPQWGIGLLTLQPMPSQTT